MCELSHDDLPCEIHSAMQRDRKAAAEMTASSSVIQQDYGTNISKIKSVTSAYNDMRF